MKKQPTMPRHLLSLLIGLVFASAVWAFDSWPQWQGPYRNGLSTEKGLRDHWEEAPPLIWKAKGFGDGYAGPAVAGGIVCTLGDRNGKATVIAVREQDGKELWATNPLQLSSLSPRPLPSLSSPLPR